MKVVIVGSVKLQDKIQEWIEYWNNQKDCIVLDYPRPVPKENFDIEYQEIYKDFYKNITESDILFVANESKNDIDGYIGYETFAELGFALAQKLINGKNIKLILAKMLSKEVSCYEEISLWLRIGWIEVLERK